MKKTLLVVLTMMGLTVSSHAQGTVNFGNLTGATGRVYTNINGSYGLATTNGFSYTVALYWGALGSTEGQLVQIASGTGNFTAGRFTVGTATTGAATAPGADAVFQIRGWTGNYATYEEAYAAALGGVGGPVYVDATEMFINHTGNPPLVTPAALSGWTSANPLILGVPEPSTFALAGLGAVSLLLFRRRKSSGTVNSQD